MKFLINTVFSIFCLISIFACSSAKESNHSRLHTSKLQKQISLRFTHIDSLAVKFKKTFADASIKVFAVDSSKNRVLIEDRSVYDSVIVSLDLPENIEDFDYLVAVFEALDASGTKISNVTNYKIGEQDQINAAKESLKNRH